MSSLEARRLAMQLFNKSMAKKSLVHTWYIYPILVAISSLLWIWGFSAFHQPTKHQRLTLFFATDINNSSFLTDIQNEHYDKETLREVEGFYSLPDAPMYSTKLDLYLNDSDLLILDEKTMEKFQLVVGNLFVPFDAETKTNYLFAGNEYLTYDGKDYGVLFKRKGEVSYFSSYMTFDEEKDYYLTLSITSKNLGKMLDANNEHYDNALTFMHYLVEKTL